MLCRGRGGGLLCRGGVCHLEGGVGSCRGRVGWVLLEWGVSYRGGVCHVGVGWVMQGV